jgi:hypothetical protein
VLPYRITMSSLCDNPNLALLYSVVSVQPFSPEFPICDNLQPIVNFDTSANVIIKGGMTMDGCTDRWVEGFVSIRRAFILMRMHSQTHSQYIIYLFLMRTNESIDIDIDISESTFSDIRGAFIIETAALIPAAM